MSVGLYVHIPFCQKKCHYCDFNSYDDKGHLVNAYLDALKQELLLYRAHVQIIGSIYIGGGTPSTLSPENITKLLDAVRRSYYIQEKAEITMEVNPGTCNCEKLMMMRMHGVNRLSIGLQAFNNDSLSKLGRIHTVEDFLATYKEAREAGFDNINVDLIFGLPWQTGEEWQDTLAGTLELKPDHISLYSLTIEKDTHFGRELQAGNLHKIDEDLEAEMYENAVKLLTANGYEHYEISNFAKPGKRCEHNQLYWRNEDYLGVGAGATSYLGRIRYTNLKDISAYIQKVMGQGKFATCERESLPHDKRLGETIMLYLRMMDGFNKIELGKRFKMNIDEIYGPTIKVLASEGLLQEKDDQVSLTAHGLMVANRVFQRFI